MKSHTSIVIGVRGTALFAIFIAVAGAMTLELPMFARGQAQSAPAPTAAKFEVVSVKPTEDRFLQLVKEGKNPIRIDDAQATLLGVDLSTVIQMAYELPKYRVVIPSAASNVHFNISGKLPEGSKVSQVPEMLQDMLTDRFQMEFHREERILPVYFLVVGKGKPKLTPTTTLDPAKQGCGVTGVTYQCHGVTIAQVADELTKGYYLASAAQAQSLPAAAGLAEEWPDRPVIDKTGLDGIFDFTADFGKPNIDNKAQSAPADESEAISAFSAIKSIGLVVQPTKQPVEILVVDRIETKPTEN